MFFILGAEKKEVLWWGKTRSRFFRGLGQIKIAGKEVFFGRVQFEAGDPQIELISLLPGFELRAFPQAPVEEWFGPWGHSGWILGWFPFFRFERP